MTDSSPALYRKVLPHSSLITQIHDDWYTLLGGAYITERSTLHHHDTLHRLLQEYHKALAIARKSVGSREVVHKAFEILRAYQGECPAPVVQTVNEALTMSITPDGLVWLAEIEVTKRRLLMIYREREVEMGGGVKRGGMDSRRWWTEGVGS